jgi:hypothetical protein
MCRFRVERHLDHRRDERRGQTVPQDVSDQDADLLVVDADNIISRPPSCSSADTRADDKPGGRQLQRQN